jgi:hypothetical protein
MIRASRLAFFATSRLHAPYALAILALVLAGSVYLAAVNTETGLDDGLGMVLFVQMFLASTGFTERARRGHFDPLLTFSNSRRAVLFAHWMVSVLPGAAAWVAIAVVALASGNHEGWSALAGPRAAALFIVSANSWVLGFATTRGAGGVAWTAALLATAMQRPTLVTSMSPPLLLFCPFALMRNGQADEGRAAVAVVLACVPLVCLCRRAPHLDIYLLEQA